MTRLYAISDSKTKRHLGSILADKIVCDPSDNYLLFLEGNRTIAMFPAANIEIESPEFSLTKAIEGFTEYQSNHV